MTSSQRVTTGCSRVRRASVVVAVSLAGALVAFAVGPAAAGAGGLVAVPPVALPNHASSPPVHRGATPRSLSGARRARSPGPASRLPRSGIDLQLELILASSLLGLGWLIRPRDRARAIRRA